MSHDYASPYAGAIVACVKDTSEKIQFYSKFTFQNLGKLQQQLGGPECGLDWAINNEFWEHRPPEEKLEFFKSYVPFYEEVPKAQAPEGASGIRYKTWVFNAPVFIDSLSKYLKGRGIKVIKRTLNDIREAYIQENTIVFNCTGLGSKTLKGVEDPDVIPVRAQVVVIRAPHVKELSLYWKDESDNYVIKRPGPRHEVILGGFYQPNVWNRDIKGDETQDILKRVSKFFPHVIAPGTPAEEIDIVRVVSAFRPGRTKGARIEKELIDGSKILVHNYGATGTGYAQGLGMAEASIRLVFKDQKL